MNEQMNLQTYTIYRAYDSSESLGPGGDGFGGQEVFLGYFFNEADAEQIAKGKGPAVGGVHVGLFEAERGGLGKDGSLVAGNGRFAGGRLGHLGHEGCDGLGGNFEFVEACAFAWGIGGAV